MGLSVSKNNFKNNHVNEINLEDNSFVFFANLLDNYDREDIYNKFCNNVVSIKKYLKKNSNYFIDELILETLRIIRLLFDYEVELPKPFVLLKNIATEEKGWIQVVKSLINVVPIDDFIGPSLILILIEAWPLPSKESIKKLVNLVFFVDFLYFKNSLNKKFKNRLLVENILKKKKVSNLEFIKHRNLCIVLASLAERLAGHISIILMDDIVLKYLISNLNKNFDLSIILFSIIALEKFAQTSKNKEKILKKLSEFKENPLCLLENWYNDENDLLKHQIGFCAKWCLDNIFIFDKRPYSFENIKNENLNVILNSKDVSEYLKISPNGLYARCDRSSFESVRSTFKMDNDIWYYEVTLITGGVMQIGFATKKSKFLTDEGYGIGDDKFSIGYDGCRQLIWFDSKTKSHKHIHRPWIPGDILGCLIDLNSYQIIFYLNGSPLPPCKKIFENAKDGFYLAASFMSFQECKFNFGAEPFKYSPKEFIFKIPNCNTILSLDEKIIFPRHIQLIYKELSEREDNLCKICYDNERSTTLLPCNHSDFCVICSLQFDLCPFCKSQITGRRN